MKSVLMLLTTTALSFVSAVDFDKEAMNYRNKCYKANYSTSYDTYTNHTINEMILEAKDVCQGQVDLLVFIHSSVEHSHKRNIIRQTWASVSNFKDRRIRYVFVVGKGLNALFQHDIIQESLVYADVVQVDFVDTYRNLGYKHLYAFKWIIRHCNHAQFVFKADDDVVVNIFQVHQLLRVYFDSRKDKPFYYCVPNANPYPDRHPGYKWYISWEEWPESTLPRFCQGYGYLFSISVVKQSFYCSLWRPYVAADDAFITGIIRKHLNITLIDRFPAFDMMRDMPKELSAVVANKYLVLLNHWGALAEHLLPITWRKIVSANFAENGFVL